MATTGPEAGAGASEPFPFPRYHNFPAFFTRQPTLTTLHAQLTRWSELVLAYARHHRLFRLSLSTAPESELFYNRKLDRRLAPADIRELLEFMRKDGRIEYDSSSSSGGSGSGGDVVFVHWRKVESWARLIEKYVEDTAQKNSVLTIYELVEGEGTRGTELHGMDTVILLKALNVLVKKGKAQIFGQDDSQGVKFF